MNTNTGSGMDRRDFLKVAAASAAIGVAAPILAAQAGDSLKGKIKTAVQYEMVKCDGGPVEKLKLVKAAGIDGVEINTKTTENIDELVKASQETGIPIHGVVHGWSLDGIPASIDLAKKLGADSVLIVPGTVNETNAYDVNYTKSQAVYREIIPYAAEQKMMLLVENVWNNFLLSPLEMARYVDELDSPWLQAYFDCGNMLRYGWTEQWIRILGKRTKKIHMKEFSRKKMEDEGLWKGFDVEIGEGSNDWAAIRKALDEAGFNGWASAEVGGGDLKRIQQVAGEMNKVLALG